MSSYDANEIKTKHASVVLKNLGVDDKKTLIILPETNDLVVKSFRNIEGVSVMPVATINAYHLLTHKHVVFRQSALEKLEK